MKLSLVVDRVEFKVVISILLSVSILLCAPFLGSTSFSSLPTLAFDDDVAQSIFWRLRVPRVFFGFLAGAALGMAGLVFQAMFRNALATPYTLGVASGASFGASLAIHLGFTGAMLGFEMVTVFGFLGATLATGVVYTLTRIRSQFDIVTMLLAGVAISFFFSSLIIFLQYVSDFTGSFRIIRWLMGGLEVVGFRSVYQMLPLVLFGLLVVFFFRRDLDILSTGDELAVSRGIDVHRVRFLLFFVVSLMVGGVVSLCGPIGFVGLIVPHMCRLLFGVRHVRLIWLTFIISGAFLVVCDLFGRVIVAPAEMPVGVVTALLGGPFFLWILLTQKSRVSHGNG